MGLRTARVLQTFFVVTLAWSLYSIIGGWHWFFAFAVFCLSLINATTIWMLRYHLPTIARLCSNSVCERYVLLLCRATGQQRPLDGRPKPTQQLLIRTRKDAEQAVGRAKEIVRGHDATVESVMDRILENVILQSRNRRKKSTGPLASFVMVGKRGIGKLYLARVISKLLYQSGRVEVFDCNRLSVEALIGFKEHPGELLELIGAEPFQLLVFENVDRASSDVCAILRRILDTGELNQPGTNGRTISFRKTVVVFTTTRADVLTEPSEGGIATAAWRESVIARLRDDANVDGGILNSADDVLVCEDPDDEIKAEVASLLLQKECRAHEITLSHVHPVILGTLVMQMESASGFEHSPNRIKKLLRAPLVNATAGGHQSLSLRVRTPALQNER